MSAPVSIPFPSEEVAGGSDSCPLSSSLPPWSPSQTSPHCATLSGALQTTQLAALEHAALLLTPVQPSQRSDACCPEAGQSVQLLSVSSDRPNCSRDGALVFWRPWFDGGEHPAVFLSPARAASAQLKNVFLFQQRHELL